MLKINALVEQVMTKQIDRRQFLMRATALGLSTPAIASILAACGAESSPAASSTSSTAPAPATQAPSEATTAPVVLTATPGGGSGGKDAVRWVSPIGSLESIDETWANVAIKMGYWEQNNIDPKMEGGPMEATAGPKLVMAGQSDMCWVSPGVFSLSLEANMPLISIFDICRYNVFDFAVRVDGPIKDVKDIAGKTIVLGDAGWQSIVDPMLVEIGVDPKSVKYVAAGPQWGNAVADGQGDVAFTWEGFRGQWDGQGLKLRYFLGYEFSKMFANSLQVRKQDLEDKKLLDIYTRWCRGVAMGLEFMHNNIRAAGQISLQRYPVLYKTYGGAKWGVEAARQMEYIFRGDWQKQPSWGWHDLDAWKKYFGILKDLNQITRDIKVEDVITNDLIAAANDFDHDKVKADADNFKLEPEYEQAPVNGPL